MSDRDTARSCLCCAVFSRIPRGTKAVLMIDLNIYTCKPAMGKNEQIVEALIMEERTDFGAYISPGHIHTSIETEDYFADHFDSIDQSLWDDLETPLLQEGYLDGSDYPRSSVSRCGVTAWPELCNETWFGTDHDWSLPNEHVSVQYELPHWDSSQQDGPISTIYENGSPAISHCTSQPEQSLLDQRSEGRRVDWENAQDVELQCCRLQINCLELTITELQRETIELKSNLRAQEGSHAMKEEFSAMKEHLRELQRQSEMNTSGLDEVKSYLEKFQDWSFEFKSSLEAITGTGERAYAEHEETQKLGFRLQKSVERD